MRLISCRRCGKPCPGGRGGLCATCHKAEHASRYTAEFDRNSKVLRSRFVPGVTLCGRCRKPIASLDQFSVGHIIAHAHGGSAALSNLRPEHRSCNYGGKRVVVVV